jgi:hypothetical protein
MENPLTRREENICKAIEACRTLIKTLSDPSISPLEREAGHILAKALRIQVEALGLLENPEVQRFLEVQQETRPIVMVKRFPQDFPSVSESGLPAAAAAGH